LFASSIEDAKDSNIARFDFFAVGFLPLPALLSPDIPIPGIPNASGVFVDTDTCVILVESIDAMDRANTFPFATSPAPAASASTSDSLSLKVVSFRFAVNNDDDCDCDDDDNDCDDDVSAAITLLADDVVDIESNRPDDNVSASRLNFSLFLLANSCSSPSGPPHRWYARSVH
jgi:hypothetical protein